MANYENDRDRNRRGFNQSWNDEDRNERNRNYSGMSEYDRRQDRNYGEGGYGSSEYDNRGNGSGNQGGRGGNQGMGEGNRGYYGGANFGYGSSGNDYNQGRAGSDYRYQDDRGNYSFQGGRGAYQGRGGGNWEDRSWGDRNFGERNYGGSDYGYGRERNRGDYDQGRDFWDKTKDEVSSWFGDEDARRRRQMDDRRGDFSGGEHRGKGPRGYTRSDERIKEDINDRLSDAPQVDASEIDVSINNGEVTLSGTVNSRWEKRHAEDIVESISGVKHVENRLRVGASASSSTSGNFSTGTTGATTAGTMGTTASGTPGTNALGKQ